MPRVLISDKLSQDAVRIFEDRGIEVTFDPGLGKDPDKLLATVGTYDGLAIRSATKATAEVIAAAPSLKVIGRAGIGVDNIDIPAATGAGIVVMNTPFGNSITTAEHAIAMMLSLCRQIPEANASTHGGKWEKSRFMGQEVFGKTLGVIGCGNIGGIVADRAQGLKMRVIAFDPFLTDERAVEIGVEKVDLEGLLTRADIITLHTPLTDQTRNILSAEAIGKTKKGVRIVNCARGGLVDEDALLEALNSGHVAGAALDVFAEEPATAHPLFGRDDVVLTPHLGAATREAQENVAIQIAEQMADYLLLGAVSNALNTPSVTAEEAPRLKPFIALAERLGGLAGQAVEGSLEEIEIGFAGGVSGLKTDPMVSAALAGILRVGLADVNLINAPSRAKDRGIKVTELKTDSSPHYESTVSVRITADGKEHRFTGALFGGAPRVVRIGDIRLEAGFTPHMLLVRNDDKPGFIGALGGLLGEGGVNIATFHLGRDEAGGEALALVAMDGAVPEGTLKAITSLAAVKTVRPLQF